MGNEQLPIACRYVPYDQWLITHIDPTWKIRHLKQRIIAKCLNLPFDPRFTRNARPPSPITFAPTDGPTKIITPGSDTGSDHQESTGEGYEEDDEWEDLDIKVNVKSKLSTFRQQKREQEPQITTHTYTLVRFSTCQILEEECQISWYNIQPHELVELHPSFPPFTLASSLVSPMSIPSPPPDIVALPHTKFTQKHKTASSTTATYPGDLPTPSLISLPRHIPKLYIQPYWQGWVRGLKVISRIQTTPVSDESIHPSLEGNDREGNMDMKQRDKIEWREKWVVIHDGVINICRTPNDKNPMRLPFSSLLALRGPESLPHSKNFITKARSTPRTPEPPTMTSEDPLSHSQEAMESVPEKEFKRNTRNLKKTRKDGLLSTASSPSLRNLGQDHQPQRMASYTAIPITYSKSSLPLTAEDCERDGDHHGFSFSLGGKDKSKSKGTDRRSNSSRDKDKNNAFIPTSREDAEQAGMKVICIKFRVQPTVTGEGDKAVGQDGAFSNKRRYTSTGPSLALVAGVGRAKLKVRTSTGPHVVTNSDGYVGDQPHEISMDSGRTTSPAAGTSSVTTSPISHTGFNWNLFGGSRIDDRERKTTERHKAVNDDRGLSSPSIPAAEDFEAPTSVNSLGWKSVSISPSRLEKASPRSTEFGGEDDKEGCAVIIPERSNTDTPSSPTTARPNVIIPILTPTLATTTPAAAIVSPQSQLEHQASNHPHSDSSSSISVSSPIFAHSANESDLDDEPFSRYGPGGGATSAMSGMSATNRPRKGYRYGGYHVQPQLKKAKNEGGDERAVSKGGAEKAAKVEVESKLGDGGQPEQTRPEEKERQKDAEREGWVALDMVNDNAFNSILRILHRHSPPFLSSSFTHSHTIINPPRSLQPNTPRKTKLSPTEELHHAPKDQRVPSDTDDDGRHAVKNLATSNRVHPPILKSLITRAAPNQHLAYVALPYPEWRLELVNQARRAGMGERGRPLDLALHGWGREFEEMAAAARERKLQREKELEKEKTNRRKSVQSHVSTIKERGRRVSRVVGGSDADDDDDGEGDGDEEEAMGTTQLDSDSEEESDTEWLAWMTDLPRQFLAQQQLLAVQTPQSSRSLFSDPFSPSSLVEGADSSLVRPRTQEEERISHADRIRHLEPSSTVRVIHPSPTSTSFYDSLKQLPTLSSHSSLESLNHQRGSSGHNSSPFPGISSMDDPLVNKGNHPRSVSRSLQHLGSHRYVKSVPEEGGDGHNPAAPSSSPEHALHHSASMDYLSSQRNRVNSHRQNDSIASNEFTLGKPILTTEQIMQIESEVFTSPTNPSSPSSWIFPLIPVPSPPHPPSTTRPPASISTNASGEVRAPSAINRFTSSDLPRWSTSLSNSLSTPPSPSASSPNSTSPPRPSVFGSLGRSPSLLGRVGVQEKEKKRFLKKTMSRDLGKDKEKEKDNAGERAISPAGASPKQRPKLFLSGLSSSTSPFSPMSVPLPNHPEIPFSTHNDPDPASGHHLQHSTSTILSSTKALRRVRSGSSLRGEESSTTPTGLGVTLPETEGKEVQKKKKGRIDRIVRGFDSSLAFAEGR